MSLQAECPVCGEFHSPMQHNPLDVRFVLGGGAASKVYTPVRRRQRVTPKKKAASWKKSITVEEFARLTTTPTPAPTPEPPPKIRRGAPRKAKPKPEPIPLDSVTT